MSRRYLNVLLGLGPVALGLIVGWFIPLGRGSAVLIGGVVGIIVGYLLVYSRPGRQIQLWLASPSQSREHYLAGEIDQRVIEANTLSAREAHILDEQSLDQLRHHS